MSSRTKKSVSPDKRIGRIITIIFVVVLAIVVLRGCISTFQLKSEQAEVEKTYADLQEKKADLEEELKYINTPEYIEQTARDMLKMVKPGEILYIIRGKEDADDGASANTPSERED